MTEESNEKSVQLVTFSLGVEEYAVPISDIREVVKVSEITHVPNTPDFIKGILNLRGQIVVIIDLEKRFGLVGTGTEAPSEHIIIAEKDKSTFGILVDKVSEVIRVPQSSIKEAPALVASKIDSDFIEGVIVMEDGRPYVILRLPKLLGTSELMSVKKNASEGLIDTK